MSKKFILHLAASPKRLEESYSRQVAQAFLQGVQERDPSATIKTLDLHEMDIPNMNRNVLAVMEGRKKATEEEQRILDRWSGICDEFVSADRYVVSFPNWNLAAPPILPKYFLAAAQVGRVFKYTEQGSVGLLKGKKATLIVSSGGICTNDNPVARCHAIDWLEGLLLLCGITDTRVLFCEGTGEMPEKAQDILQYSMEQALDAGKHWEEL